ncbi:MAG: tRNA pseudouridine(55) synthase TruB [Phycisphaerales bacterium]|nr:tRNA pseudouridine(55) synthase TruB [Phycisphaerales bacterium]
MFQQSSMNHSGIETISGIVNLYKPPAQSSARYVYRLRRIFGLRKVGHAGTLDPFADGVLLGCVGRGTKLVESLMGLSKRYRTTLRLGVTNRTYDTEQPFEPVPGIKPPSQQQLADTVAQFIGDIDQVPPEYSAVKINGVPSYRLAQKGQPVTKPPKKVRVDHVEILNYEWPALALEVRCGRGTYIRALARDLGKALECGACCEALTRTAVGPFRLEDSVNLEIASPESVRSALMDLAEAQRRITSTNV